MKKPFPAIVLFAALVAAPPLRADLVDILVGKRELNVITVTDMTPEGLLLPAVTAQAPVYYVAATSGFKDLGGAQAGEKKLPDNYAIRTIAKVLAGQGYLPATASTPAPTLLLVFTWGTLNTEQASGFTAEDKSGQTGDLPEIPDYQVNQDQILRFLGGKKWAAHDSSTPDLFASSARTGTHLSYESQKFHGFAEVDLYIAIVSAYDLKAAQVQKKQRLWATRISCPAAGFSLQGILPTMLAIAAPNIGRETDRPAWVNASDKYKPQIKIHDLQVLEYLEKGRLPVLEQPKSKTKSRPDSADR